MSRLYMETCIIPYDEEIADTNLKRNDWSDKEIDMRGEIQNENSTDACSEQ